MKIDKINKNISYNKSDTIWKNAAFTKEFF